MGIQWNLLFLVEINERTLSLLVNSRRFLDHFLHIFFTGCVFTRSLLSTSAPVTSISCTYVLLFLYCSTIFTSQHFVVFAYGTVIVKQYHGSLRERSTIISYFGRTLTKNSSALQTSHFGKLYVRSAASVARYFDYNTS